MVFVSGLNAVVSVTEALPVALIPEEHAVSSVRLNVIDIGRLDVAALLHALHTQRMCLKVTLAGSVPCRAVATAACGACLLRVEGSVLVTVLRTVWNKRCTAGMPARCVRSAGHSQKPPFFGAIIFIVIGAVSPAWFIVGLWPV